MVKTYHPRGMLVHGYPVQEHPLYAAWQGMKQRCNNPNTLNFDYWGGRGITYCDEWEDFVNFAHDMWPKPEGDFSLDRIDNSKGYGPDNCRWATRHEQSRNRRIFSNNTVGTPGVVPIARGYNARYDDQGVRFDLGNFDTVEEAAAAREEFIRLYQSNSEKYHERLSQGNKARRLRRDSSTGTRGITRTTCAKTGRKYFVVRRTVNGVRVRIGSFATLQEAETALQEAIANGKV